MYQDSTGQIYFVQGQRAYRMTPSYPRSSYIYVDDNQKNDDKRRADAAADGFWICCVVVILLIIAAVVAAAIVLTRTLNQTNSSTTTRTTLAGHGSSSSGHGPTISTPGLTSPQLPVTSTSPGSFGGKTEPTSVMSPTEQGQTGQGQTSSGSENSTPPIIIASPSSAVSSTGATASSPEAATASAATTAAATSPAATSIAAATSAATTSSPEAATTTEATTIAATSTASTAMPATKIAATTIEATTATEAPTPSTPPSTPTAASSSNPSPTATSESANSTGTSEPSATGTAETTISTSPSATTASPNATTTSPSATTTPSFTTTPSETTTPTISSTTSSASSTAPTTISSTSEIPPTTTTPTTSAPISQTTPSTTTTTLTPTTTPNANNSIPIAQCDIPFTYNGTMYETCAGNVTGVTTGSQVACPDMSGNWRICIPDPAFDATPKLANITVPTLKSPVSTLVTNGWIIIHQRENSGQNFTLGWESYKNGFGTLTQSYWLGNQVVYLLTNSSKYRVKLEGRLVPSQWVSAEYTSFRLDSEAHDYQLHVDGYIPWDGTNVLMTTGSGGAFYQDGMNFTTYDRKNDLSRTINCAELTGGGFWFDDCFQVCLTCEYGNQFAWYGLNGLPLLVQSRMMIKLN